MVSNSYVQAVGWSWGRGGVVSNSYVQAVGWSWGREGVVIVMQIRPWSELGRGGMVSNS